MSKWPWSHCRKILLLWTAICLGFWTIWNWSNRASNIQVRTLWLANKFLLCAYLWKPTVHWKTNKVTPRCHEIRIFMYVLTGKVVQIFWEVHKNLKKISPFAMTLLCNFKKRWEIFSNFVAFSQYMNFIWISKPDETRHHEPIVVKTRFLIQFTSLTSVTKIKNSAFEMKIQVSSHHSIYFQY